MSRRCQLGDVSFFESFRLYKLRRVSLSVVHIRSKFFDHKPLLNIWAKKGRLSDRFFRYQVIISNFNNLQIIWTPGRFLFCLIWSVEMFSSKDLGGWKRNSHGDQVHSAKTDKKFIIWLTRTLLLQLRTTIFIPSVSHNWVEQRKFTSYLMVPIKIVKFLSRNQQKKFFNVFDWFWEGRNTNIGRLWPNSLMFMEVKVHAN